MSVSMTHADIELECGRVEDRILCKVFDVIETVYMAMLSEKNTKVDNV